MKYSLNLRSVEKENDIIQYKMRENVNKKKNKIK